MKRAALLLLLLTASVAHAQMYKWKDDKGVTHFSESPPPVSAKNSEVKNYNTSGTGSVDLPPELADVVRARPVVLYTSNGCGAGCNLARTLLATRGIPYREKTVNTPEDHEALKKAGSDGQVPLLLIGRARQLGFEQASWDAALTEAGYPATKVLPAGYSNPSPTPAAGARAPSAEEVARNKAAAREAAAAAEKARRERDTPANGPDNFRF
ncbi:glutaredoxin family protein [Pseudoduganella violaceinigra]|uniref:glutaredoxin family protein n=1 Tax=Pseudoduganella violaceinigra TaxID=246602 RepID=UPI000404EE26|nr:glutaredoxin family protein [Pseudoduganella violaceinigra]